MNIRELINTLEDLAYEHGDDINVCIGMMQRYGSDFAMEICSVSKELVNSWYHENDEYIVLTEGSQMGTVGYQDEEDY